MRLLRVATTIALLQGGAVCAQTSPASIPVDTVGLSLIPPGFGTLKLDNIKIELQLSDVIVKLTPLDENVIRTLVKDSYASLRDLVASKRSQINRVASQRGLRTPSLWYGEFYGLAPDARFSPLEVTITVSGRDYQPVEVIPVTPGFGEQRLALRARQSAIYLFDDAVDVSQPVVIAVGGTRSNAGDWTEKLRRIENERSSIRSRSQPRSTPPE